MFLTIYLIIAISIVKFTQPLNLFTEPTRDQRAQNLMTLGKVVQFIVDSKVNDPSGRRVIKRKIKKPKNLYNTLQNKMSHGEVKKWLRQEEKETFAVTDLPIDIGGLRDEQANLVEAELKDALSQKKSALYDRPYVEQGRNDFLVMRPGVLDPFVTVVPNSIYYNIEKKCVNWLDDCSLRGIRSRLLRGVQSPYK